MCRRAAVLALAAGLSPSLARAERFSQRGFLVLQGTFYPETAPNDAIQAVGEALFRYEPSFEAARWLRFSAALEARMDTYGYVERSWNIDASDRTRRRPAFSIRSASATLTRGVLTLDLGKQFIRWGKVDILNPTDRLAPRDFLSVVDNDFLAVTGARLTLGSDRDIVELVWVPRLTPSRIPLYDSRWTVVPEPIENVALRDGGADFPGGPQYAVRWNHLAESYECSLSYYDGFNHLPLIEGRLEPVPAPAVVLLQRFPRIRMAGADLAWPLSLFMVKGEVGYFSSPDGDSDEYVLYVIQIERQAGELLVVGGYSGEAVTVSRPGGGFAPDRGLTRAFLGRASYTIDMNRIVAVEAAIRQDGAGLWIKGEYSNAMGGNWRVTILGNLVRGEPDDFIGQYRRNSNLVLTARYSF